jgi:hypothetical protein
MKARQLGLKFGPKIAVFDIVDGTLYAPGIADRHSGSPSAQVRMIINSIE